MKKVFYVFSFLIFQMCFAKIYGQKIYTYTNDKDHYHYSIKSDGDDFFVAGTVLPEDSYFNADIHVQKMDKDGVILWEQYYDIGANERGLAMEIGENGDLVIVGTNEFNGEWNMFALKIDQANGATIDYVQINPSIATGAQREKAYDVVYSITENKYFILGAYEYSGSSPYGIGHHNIVVALDASFNYLWGKEFEGMFFAESIIDLSGGGIFISGRNPFSFPIDYAVSLDYSGNVRWQLNEYIASCGNSYACASNSVYDAASDKIFLLFSHGEISIAVIDGASTLSPSMSVTTDFQIPDVYNAGGVLIAPFYQGINGISVNAQSNTLGIHAAVSEDSWRGYNEHSVIMVLDKDNLNLISIKVHEALNSKSLSRANFIQDFSWNSLPHPYVGGIVRIRNNTIIPYGAGFAFLDYSTRFTQNNNFVKNTSKGVHDFVVYQTDQDGLIESSCEINTIPTIEEFSFNTYPNIEPDPISHFITRPIIKDFPSFHDKLEGCNIIPGCNVELTTMKATYLDCYRWAFDFSYIAANGSAINYYSIDWGDGTPLEVHSGFLTNGKLEVAHTYSDGICFHNICITVNAIGPDGSVCSDTKCYFYYPVVNGNCPGCTANRLRNPNEIEELNTEILMYPNPASKFINLDLPFSESKYKINIYSITGERVYENTMNYGNSKNINLDKFKSGLYFIDIANDEISTREKLIIK
ncbi:T9SS type A sorting domain-containing protein [bacterium]|nr:T9SS type A sorting domain-containing protein [bacterium]